MIAAEPADFMTFSLFCMTRSHCKNKTINHWI